jgi:opacity protein-like surface antigen
MRKIALAALLAIGLMAADSGVYVGADIGKTKYSLDYAYSDSDGDSENGSFSDNGTSGTLKVGYYFDKNNRAYAALNKASFSDEDSDVDLYQFGVGYDYLIGNSDIKPFVGVLAGYSNIKPDDGESINGVYYGLQAGVNYALNGNFSVEAGYRYMKTNMDKTSNETDGSFSSTEKIEIDYISNWFVGVNYKF